MIINENNNYIALAEENGLRAWIKTAEYETTFGEVWSVVTDVVITKADNKKEIVYRKYMYNNFMKYDYIADIILDILYYLANTEQETFWINNSLDKVFSNNVNSRRFKIVVKDLKETIEQKVRYKKYAEQKKEYEIIIKDLKNELKSLVNELNKSERTVMIDVGELYEYSVITSSKKVIIDNHDIDSLYDKEIKNIKDTIEYLNKMKYCIDNDYDIDLMLDAV